MSSLPVVGLIRFDLIRFEWEVLLLLQQSFAGPQHSWQYSPSWKNASCSACCYIRRPAPDMLPNQSCSSPSNVMPTGMRLFMTSASSQGGRHVQHPVRMAQLLLLLLVAVCPGMRLGPASSLLMLLPFESLLLPFLPPPAAATEDPVRYPTHQNQLSLWFFFFCSAN